MKAKREPGLTLQTEVCDLDLTSAPAGGSLGLPPVSIQEFWGGVRGICISNVISGPAGAACGGTRL